MGGAEAARIVRMKLPRPMRFDLDDTILVSFGPAQSHWQRTIDAFADQLGPIEGDGDCGGDRGLDRIMGRSGVARGS